MILFVCLLFAILSMFQNDYISGPALEFEFKAMGNEICAVEIMHFKGKAVKNPRFELNIQPATVRIDDEEERIVMNNGRLRLVINKTGLFGYSFYFDGTYLTGSSDGSAAYITDVDYEADRIDDFNHRTPQKPYLKEKYIRERLNLDVGELIYGLGEHFTPLIKNGQSIDIWNRDGGSNSEQGYKCIPFYPFKPRLRRSG